MGLGHWLDQTFDSVNDIVTHKLLPDPVVNPLTSAAGAALDFVGGATKEGALDVLDALKWNRDNVISPTIAAALAGPASLDGPQTHFEPLVNPFNYVENFKAARGHKQQATDDAGTPLVDKDGKPVQTSTGFSPWQGAYTAGAQAATVLGGDIGAGGIGAAVFGPAGRQGFNLANPNEKSAAFDSWTNAGKYVTGIGDFALSWYADPTVLLGKTAAVARAKGLIKPLTKGAVDSTEIERITTRAPALAQDAGVLARAKEKVVTPFDAQRRITKMTDDLATMQPAERADFLARNTSMRGAPGLVSLMARAQDSDAMRLVLRYAMDPNEATKATLQNKWRSAVDEVDHLRYTKIPTLEAALTDLPTRMASFLGDNSTVAASHVLGLAQAELGRAELAEKYATDVMNVRGTLRAVPRVNVRQALSGGLADSALHLDWDVLQPTRYGVATRILKSAGQMRAGVIDMNRPGDATEQMRRFLDRVGHGTGVALQDSVKDGLMVDIAHAETEGPQAVMSVVQRAEETALIHYATLSRVAGETDQQIAENARGILSATNARRDAVRSKFGMISRSETYSGAPRLDAAGNATSRFLDEVQDGVGIWSHNPVTESQFADRIPLLDVDRLARVMNRHRLAMVGKNQGHFLAAMRGSDGAIAAGNSIVTEGLEAFNRYWKPAQLARLGWPIRVITDENLRIYSVLGAMTALPLQVHSLVKGVGQTRPAYAIRDVLADKEVKYAKQSIAGLRDVRTAGKTRSGLVDDLEDLNAHIGAADAAIGPLGQQLLAQNEALQGTTLHAVTGPRGQLWHSPDGITMQYGPAPTVGDGLVTHESLGLPEHHPAVYRPESTDIDPGVAAARDHGGFAELQAMPLDKLRQKAIYAGVDPKHADKVTSRQDLISLYGKQLVRNSGHKAIVHEPPALGDSVVRTDRHYGDTRGGKTLGDYASGHHFTTAPGKFNPADAFSAADASRIARAMGVDAPEGAMTADALRSWTGANADAATGRKFDAEVGKLLREQGRRGDNSVGPVALNLRNVFNADTDQISALDTTAISAAMGAGDPGRAMSLDELRTWVGAAGDTTARVRVKFTQEVRKALKAQGYDGVATKDASGHMSHFVFDRASVHTTMPAAPAKTYTALTEDALRTPDRTEFDNTSDLLDRLTDARDTLANARQHLTGRIDQLPEWSQAQEEQWGDLVKSALKPSQRAKILGKDTKFSGTIKMRLASGATVEVPDAGHGRQGKMNLDLASASGTMRDLAGLDRRQVAKMRVEMGDPATILPTTDAVKGSQDEVLHDMSYGRSWERAVNDQIANSMIGKAVLQGKDLDAIVAEMKRSPRGREIMRQNPVRGSDPHQWVQDVEQHINHYLPTPELKYAASQGMATHQMLKDAIPEAANRPVIHGESLSIATGGHTFTRAMERTVDSLYRRLGTTPTDALSRHPFFTAHYREEMRRQLAVHPAQDADHLSEADMLKMQAQARSHALKQVKDVLFDTANSTHLGATLRFVSPFYNAWAEALTVWSKLWMDDPSRLARIVQVWNAPSKMHATYTDSYGQEQIALPLPKGIAKAMGASSLGVPKNTLQQLVFQGQYWWMPGAGAPVTVPLGEIVRQRPDLATSMKPLLPYGAGANPIADVLPSTVKKFAAVARQEDDTTYAGDWLARVQQLATDRQLGKNHLSDPELIAEAHHQAGALTAFKALTSLVAPAQVQVRAKYQMFLDQYRTLQTQYRAYPDGKDPQGRTADQAFLQANGDDFFYLLGPKTQSNIGGVAPTVAGYKAEKKYADFIQTNPQWGKFFVGNEDQGDYSQQVEQYQLQTRVGGGDMDRQRQRVTPADAIKDSQVSQGWDQFRRIDTLVDNVLAERGLKNINVKAAADVKQLKANAVANIVAQYPAWQADYQSFDPGKTDRFVNYLKTLYAKNDPRFADRPGYTTLGRYLSLRATLVNELASRKAAGGSDNLEATNGKDNNTDLKDLWDAVVGNLRQQDTAFADLQTRWLQGDRLNGGQS